MTLCAAWEGAALGDCEENVSREARESVPGCAVIRKAGNLHRSPPKSERLSPWAPHQLKLGAGTRTGPDAAFLCAALDISCLRDRLRVASGVYISIHTARYPPCKLAIPFHSIPFSVAAAHW